MTNESNLARRWANRRATGDPTVRSPDAPNVSLDPAAQLLSDYEDAVMAHAVHLVTTYNPATQDTESAHLLKSRQLHAEMRRLRVEVLHLLDLAMGQEAAAD